MAAILGDFTFLFSCFSASIASVFVALIGEVIINMRFENYNSWSLGYHVSDFIAGACYYALVYRKPIGSEYTGLCQGYRFSWG
jgi:cytosine/uracil/thiamine/allantoin permease